MADATTKIVVDADEVIKAAKDLSQLPLGIPQSAQHVYREFLGHFLHLPSDLFVCSEVPVTSSTGDRIIRFSIGAPKLEVLTAALTALKVGLEFTHSPSADAGDSTTTVI